MEKFSDVLKDLVIESGKSLRTIHAESGIPSSQLSRYLKGTLPKVDVALRLAKYFDCSLDFLFGLSDTKGAFVDKYDPSKFVSRYDKALADSKTTNWKLSHQCVFSESNYRAWKHGMLPKMETIVLIADGLNCSIDYLLGK